MAQRDLKVTLIGEDKTGKAFGSAAGGADTFGNKMKGVGKVAAQAFGAAAIGGVVGFGAALFQGVKDAASYEQITNQLAQTLKSTGGAAGASIDQLKAYAGELESISGVDEELILSSQNVLATFTNLKNGVGAGNDIFNQASEAALNLSTTMGGDLQGASVMVGKALNDPLAGITALSRAGVQLTQSQKDTIAAMVETGNVAGAQKIILGELETQFGGAAAAAGEGLTGSLARAKDAFSDIFREIGTNLLPVLADVAEWAAATLPPAFETAKGAVVQLGEAVAGLRQFFEEHQKVAVAVAGAIGTALTAMAVAATISAVKSVGAWLTVATTSTAAGATSSKSAAQVVVGWTVMAAQSMASAVRIAAAWLISLGPIALVIAAVVAVTALIVKNWDTISSKTAALWSAVKSMTSAAWASLTGAVSSGVSAVAGVVSGLPGRILGALGGLGGLLVGAGRDLLAGLARGIGDAVGNVVAKAREAAAKVVSAVKGAFGINSPSRVFAEIGGQLGAGMVVGMDRSQSRVQSSAQDMLDAASLTAARPLVSARLAATGTPVEGARLTAGSRTDALLQELLIEVRGVHGATRAIPRDLQMQRRKGSAA